MNNLGSTFRTKVRPVERPTMEDREHPSKRLDRANKFLIFHLAFRPVRTLKECRFFIHAVKRISSSIRLSIDPHQLFKLVDFFLSDLPELSGCEKFVHASAIFRCSLLPVVEKFKGLHRSHVVTFACVFHHAKQ